MMPKAEHDMIDTLDERAAGAAGVLRGMVAARSSARMDAGHVLPAAAPPAVLH